MNYWPSEVCNLTETNVPFFSMIRDLSVTGATTAKNMYRCGGWMAHHNTDIWRIAGPVDGLHDVLDVRMVALAHYDIADEPCGNEHRLRK